MISNKFTKNKKSAWAGQNHAVEIVKDPSISFPMISTGPLNIRSQFVLPSRQQRVKWISPKRNERWQICDGRKNDVKESSIEILHTNFTQIVIILKFLRVFRYNIYHRSVAVTMRCQLNHLIYKLKCHDPRDGTYSHFFNFIAICPNDKKRCYETCNRQSRDKD